MEHCEKYAPLISAAVDGELCPAERRELMDHLAQCPACREIYGEMMAMHEAFSQLDAEVPGDLTGDVMAKVRTQKQVRKPRHAWWQIAAAAACCALVFLGYQHLQGGSPADQVAEATSGKAASYAVPMDENASQAVSEPSVAASAQSGTDSAVVSESTEEAAARDPENSTTAAAGQEIMENVLTYFRSCAPRVSATMTGEAADEAQEEETGAVPCPTLSSSAPELEMWVIENIPAEGYSSDDATGARAWLITAEEYETLRDYLDQEGIPYTFDDAGDPAEGQETREMVCVVYLETEAES